MRGRGCADRRYSALARRCVSCFRGIVNCGPARRCVWPVLAPAQAWVRAGVWRRGGWDSVGMSGVRFTPALRFCWNALRSVHACCLTHSAKQDGLRNVAFLFRRGRTADLYVLKRLYGHPTWRVHFWSVRFLTAARGTGERGRRHGVSAFLRKPIGFDMFSAGVRWGCAPQTAPKSLRLSGLSSFDSRCGYVLRGEGDSGTTETCPSPIYARASRVAARSLLFAQSLESGRVKRKRALPAAPRLRQRVFDSLDSLHAAAGLRWRKFAAPSPGHTGRPARL